MGNKFRVALLYMQVQIGVSQFNFTTFEYQINADCNKISCFRNVSLSFSNCLADVIRVKFMCLNIHVLVLV